MKYILLFLSITMATAVFGHELSTVYINTNLYNDGKLEGIIKVDVLNIKDAITLDGNQNGELTWAEIIERQSIIETYVVDNLSFSRNNIRCPVSLNEQIALQDIRDSVFLVLPFSAQCNLQGDLDVSYSMLFTEISNHKAIISVSTANNDQVLVIDNPSKVTSFDVQDGNRIQAFGEFVYQGIFHILIGLDHILFLLTLLLTVCLTRQHQTWAAIPSKRLILTRTLWMVTSFTLAHSITLSGTALGWLPTMGSWIEVVIAASILFNVLNNLFPLIHRLSIITFIFGLIHGMGFAGALAELGLPEDAKLLTVLAFNLGVEVGQIGILIIVLPILMWCRRFPSYATRWMPILSVLIGLLAIYWIVERALF